jgi:hypothetical protein
LWVLEATQISLGFFIIIQSNIFGAPFLVLAKKSGKENITFAKKKIKKKK